MEAYTLTAPWFSLIIPVLTCGILLVMIIFYICYSKWRPIHSRPGGFPHNSSLNVWNPSCNDNILYLL